MRLLVVSCLIAFVPACFGCCTTHVLNAIGDEVVVRGYRQAVGPDAPAGVVIGVHGIAGRASGDWLIPLSIESLAQAAAPRLDLELLREDQYAVPAELWLLAGVAQPDDDLIAGFARRVDSHHQPVWFGPLLPRRSDAEAARSASSAPALRARVRCDAQRTYAVELEVDRGRTGRFEPLGSVVIGSSQRGPASRAVAWTLLPLAAAVDLPFVAGIAACLLSAAVLVAPMEATFAAVPWISART
jgi:hypothetical protein